MYKKILVPIDGSDASQQGLSEAVKLAKGLGATLRLVHVVNEFIIESGYAPALYHQTLIDTIREAGRKVLGDAEALVRGEGVELKSDLVETLGGRAADSIVALAKQWPADLIVMGTHGRRGLSRLAMGSDAEMVLRRSTVPVLLIRTSERG